MTDMKQRTEDREQLLRAVESGDNRYAMRVARMLLQGDSGSSLWSFVRKAVSSLSADTGGLHPFKVALLSSFSTEFLHDPVISYAFLDGIRVEIYQAGFGQYRQEILDAQSGLFKWNPDVVILAVEGEDWAPALYHKYLDAADSQGDSLLREPQEAMDSLIRTFRTHSTATLLIHNFVPPVWRQLGILDGHQGVGQSSLVHKLNEHLYGLVRETPGAYVVDYEGLVARFGAANWFDLRMAHYAKAPIARPMLSHLAKEYAKFFRALTGKAKKCLVVDLDNTLWGGIVGEDGLHGIKLGAKYPGSAYQAFQRDLLTLQKRGIILAVSSKNNETDAEAVFASHDQMILKREHFAAWKVNWNPKSQSLAEIARELNIGLDHIVFVDDNQAECEQVAAALPMVTVIALPQQPERYSEAVLGGGLFDRLSFSEEDRRRSELYRQRADAETLRAQSTSLEEFYRSLEMMTVFAPVEEASLARAAELTQKTNQFNATTIRCTEADLAARMADPSWILTTVQVRDRFGDNGIVGVMMARMEQDRLDIETFLLSCRVIGRTVETAMLAYLAQQARMLNLPCLAGRIIPTAKNEPVRELFARHGFEKVTGQEQGESTWRLCVRDHPLVYPEWMKIIESPLAGLRM